jgi:hypothetical protein
MARCRLHQRKAEHEDRQKKRRRPRSVDHALPGNCEGLVVQQAPVQGWLSICSSLPTSVLDSRRRDNARFPTKHTLI